VVVDLGGDERKVELGRKLIGRGGHGLELGYGVGGGHGLEQSFWSGRAPAASLPRALSPRVGRDRAGRRSGVAREQGVGDSHKGPLNNQEKPA
jgi:hypothetical protein